MGSLSNSVVLAPQEVFAFAVDAAPPDPRSMRRLTAADIPGQTQKDDASVF